MPPDVCEFLPWDSDFFGARIGRVRSGYFSPEAIPGILDWSRGNSIDCLYALAPADDAAALQAATQNGFDYVDNRVTYRASLDDLKRHSGGSVVAANAQDLSCLRELARTSHRDSRFYFDWRFQRDRCDELFATWIERSFHGYAQAVLVAVREGQTAGYCTCHLDGGKGSIGLIAVDARYRGHGLGTELVASAISWFENAGAHTVEVVTQGRNRAAHRLYQRCGFLISDVSVWYHRWSKHPAKQEGDI